MSIVTSQLVEDAVLQGFQEGISFGLGEIPVVGAFAQAIFGHIWNLAFADRTAAQKQAAMDSLFESVSKMIDKALSQNVADQARAYNASISQLGQDYRVSVESYKESPTPIAAQKVVIRFENCKSTLVHMLNLYSQPSYMKQTVLSYGSAIAMYITLLREMMLSGKECRYSNSEIKDFQEDINQRLKSAYEEVMYEAVRKLVKESGEFKYPVMGNAVMDLGKLVGGLMNYNTEWHDGKPCLIAPSHPDYYDCDLVNNKAYYQLQLRRKTTANKNYYGVPQIFMNGRPGLHVYTNLDQELQISRFTVENTMHVKVRAYYLVDMDDYDSSDIEVTISASNTQAYNFHTNKRELSIASMKWVRLYYSSASEGGAWSTDYDRFSDNMRMYYDQYSGFEAQKGKVYTITTKAGSSATKNYYIIGFEIVPVSGVPAVLDSLFNAVTDTTKTLVSGATSVVGSIGKLIH
ncbi:hypothetical protein KP509_03G009600 [Ceratopteris richardii]|uniref:Pesticidal crystal protein domain-containing protein n=1 Tax=Ceratopteris richardii TaxID=49495 RepID=A0A8T2V4D8_CERRI|nr:hypothetical protein KP509_03G009600 [Ceratopteris richardii]